MRIWQDTALRSALWLLLGGWIGSGTGLKATLIAGLALQNVAYSDREELSTRVGFYSMANGALRGGHGLERPPL